MTRRAVIWAGVSSRPQAEPDKDSIDNQIKDARALCESKGWTVVDVLVVPGESRSYIDIAEAIVGIDERLRPGEVNAYRRLLVLLSERAFDVLVFRSRDRLGRTDSLIAGVEERCRRAGVLVWSMAMPPSGSEAGDLYVSAVERAGAQREIVEIRRRLREGMDARARRGRLISSVVPFGYSVEFARTGAKFERRAVVNEREATAYRLLMADILSGKCTIAEIVDRLQTQFPERSWSHSSLYTILRAPFYIGVVTRLRKRLEGETALLRVIDPGGESILKHPRWPEVEKLLAARVARGYNQGVDEHGKIKIMLVAPGVHEPIIDVPTWLSLQLEAEARSAARRPPSPDAIWSGLAVCGLCGKRMYTSRHFTNGHHYLYYRCFGLTRHFECPNKPIRQDRLTEGVAKVIEAMYRGMEKDLQARGHSEPEPVELDIIKGLAAQRTDLQAQRERLELMLQTGRISFETFDQRAAGVDRALAEVEDRIAHEQAVKASKDLARERFLSLGSLREGLAERLKEADPVDVRNWLREMIETVVVTNKAVVEVRMRL